MRIRIIALGQTSAGDDAVGPAVLEEIERRGVPADVELVHAGAPDALLSLLETSSPVVIVDAAVGGAPGDIMEMDGFDLGSGGHRPVSSHGLGMSQVIALARQLAPERIAPSVRIVAIVIAPPRASCPGLSPCAAAAVARAADRVLELVGSPPAAQSPPPIRPACRSS